METINEKSTYVVTATFRSEVGALVTPSSCSYSLYNLTAAYNVLDSTPVTVSSSSYDFTITSDQNSIRRSANDNEQMILTLDFTYDGSTKRGTAEYRYLIKNLKALS
jgi:hypothetical protein